jgi:hypothetical protein
MASIPSSAPTPAVPAFCGELRSRGTWPARIEAGSEEELVERLRELLTNDPVFDTFAVVLDAPAPEALRERITTTAREAIQAYIAARWGSCEWIDDLVDESGWQGVRAQVDPALAPCFAGADPESDHRHVGVWADERTFVCVEISELRYLDAANGGWAVPWVVLSHWHPGSMTSGSWSDELFRVDPGAGGAVLVGVRHMDEDGVYFSVSPCPSDAATNARTVVDFVEATWIGGVQDQLVPLVAHGFPADGSAPAFAIDLLPGAENEGYELSTLCIEPPADVAAVLHELGRLDAKGARALRDAILAGVPLVWGEDAGPGELHAGWHTVLARLEEVAR